MDEQALLKKISKKRPKALEIVMNRYGAYVLAVCRNRSRGMLAGEDLEEITADVFVSLWEHGGEIEPGRLRAWLGSVARNKTVDRLRKYVQVVSLDDSLPLCSDDLFDTLEQREKCAVVQEALGQLNTRDREIFYRYYDLCQTAQEIAREMSMNPSTVRTRLSRGRETLKKQLCEGGYFHEPEV